MSVDVPAPQSLPGGFYSGLAFSSEDGGWRTPRYLFLALCRYEAGLPPDAPEELVPMPWVDPAASRAFALVPNRFTIEDSGLTHSWCPPPGAPSFVYVNPEYGNPEEVCPPRCKKKVCRDRGRHCLVRVPGIGDWVHYSRSEALAWGMTTINMLPHRGGSDWYAEMLNPGPEAGAWMGGLALPGYLSPLNPYRATSTWNLYRWQHLEVELAVLKGRETFGPSDGSEGKNGAGFDSVVAFFRGRMPSAWR